MYNRAINMVGASPTTNVADVTNAKSDINQALRLFKNSARRYTTRKEVTTNLVAGQQYYTFPEDMVRITEVKSNTGSGSYNWPLVGIDSEAIWNRYNIIPNNTLMVPQFFFVRGRNEIGLYPIPSTNVTAGLIVSYEPRMNDMILDDTTTTTVTVSNGSQYVTSPSTNFNTNMVGMNFSVTDGSDGNWYLITAATATQLTLENVYQGVSESAAPCTIGLVPDIPEEYQLGLVYYACYNYYLKRNEMANATTFKGLYEELLSRFIDVYAAKTTGIVQKSISDDIFNIFWIPPQGLSS